jgi:deoxyribonuclease V
MDISSTDERGMAKGAVVVLRLPELTVVESTVAEERVEFPYVPGFLSFREAPLLLAAWERLSLTPDLVVVDAQGIAHPRRLGLASHLGLFLDVPTIGCAKSVLCGRHGDLGEDPGASAFLLDKGEVVGAALRTKRGTKPVYVSIGHKVDLEAALHWVLACCHGYRLPEPTRLAHLAAAGRLAAPIGEERGAPPP